MARESLYEIKGTILKVINDVEKKAKELLNKYSDVDDELPEFDDFEDMKKAYEAYTKLTSKMDEIISVWTRVGLVTNQIDDILLDRLSRDLSNNYQEVMRFAGWLKEKNKILKDYREMINIVRGMIKDKIKIMQIILYKLG